MTFTFHRGNWVTDFNFKQQVRLPTGDNSCTWIQVIKKRLTRQDVLRFQLPRNKVSIHDSMHNTTTLWHEQYLSKTSYKSDITMNSVQASKLAMDIVSTSYLLFANYTGCVARNPTMCLFFLSFYGCGQVIQLNDFVWCSLAFFANVVVGFRRRCRKKNVSRN